MLLLRSLFVLLVLLGPSKMIAQVNFSQIVLSGDSAPGVACLLYTSPSPRD